jgi:ureidoacrylate peracid hydrolase
MFKTLAEKIAPNHAGLVVVDVQNDFCHESGLIARQGRDMRSRQEMVGRLLQLIASAREHAVPVIFLRHINNRNVVSPASLEQKSRMFTGDDTICEEGSWGADFYRVKPQPGEAIVVKHRYSGFIETDLDLILRSKEIKTLIMTGVATNMCVESTARDGFMKDYYIVFVGDCTATSTAEDHEATLRNIRYGFGVVVNSEEIMASWARLARS